MYSLHNSKKGFTLLEVMLSAALGIIIIIAVLELLTLSSVSFTKQSSIFSTTQEISVFMLTFTKDVHNADMVNVTDARVDIISDGKQITYAYNNRTISRNSKVLITEADAVKFTQTPAGTGTLISVTVNKNGVEMRTTVYAK
ncbi:PulJ/GspJ family protein [Thermoanaerobacter mathranii]|uniref:PulJ/GspJ family protein n=1 Tax=Thermoanaerobacter mathranii TaxID=583357 RepID=UPI003D6ABC99